MYLQKTEKVNVDTIELVGFACKSLVEDLFFFFFNKKNAIFIDFFSTRYEQSNVAFYY